MRMSFDTKLTGLQVEKNRTDAKAKKVLWLSMNKMEELAKRFAPVDTGLLRRSINLHPRFEGAEEYVLADGVTYGADLEYGNTPEEVNLTSIIEWVERKGIRTGDDVFPFARYVKEKIETKGVNAQPFFRPALLEVRTVWLKQYWRQVMAEA